MKKVAIDSPLSEITLRRYEKPNVKGRELVKKFCLSMGLLQPGDSRDIVVDIFHIMLKERQDLLAEEIRQKVIDYRKENSMELLGIASPNIRRQLRRLRELHLAEKIKNRYRITEYLKISEIFLEKIEKFYLASIVDRVRDYACAIDKEFDMYQGRDE